MFANGLKQAVGPIQLWIGKRTLFKLVGQGGLANQAQSGQDDSISNKRQGNAGLKCVSLNTRSIMNKKSELNIMVLDSDPHIIGTSKEPVCPRVELIFKIIIILLIIFLGFIKSKPC